MTLRAVLFDLDGTLVDSERQCAEAMTLALAQGQNISATAQDQDYIVGRSWNEIHHYLRTAYPEALGWSMDELIAHTARAREALIAKSGVPLLPHAAETARALATAARVAIVTGSSRKEAGQSLDHVGLSSLFPVRVAAEDVSNGKPDPEGFLKGASALQVSPEECVVIEESTMGIAAGLAAGMPVVAVRVGMMPGHDQSAASVQVETLEEVTWDFLTQVHQEYHAR